MSFKLFKVTFISYSTFYLKLKILAVCSSLIIISNLKFNLFDTLLHPNDVLLKSCLIVLELGELLLQACGLGPLVCIVTLDLFLHSVEFVCQRLPCVPLFHG